MLVHSLSVGNHKLQFCTRSGQTSSLDHLWTWVGLLISSQRGSFSPHFVLELNWYYLSGTVTKILNPNFVRSLSSYKICWEFIQDFTGITSLGGNKSNICPHIVQVQHKSRLCLRLNIGALSWLVTKPGKQNFVQSLFGEKIRLHWNCLSELKKSKPCPHMVKDASLSRLSQWF